MSATSVGQIGLDLVVNQNQFNKQMVGVQSLAKKTGKILVASFGVKQLVKYSKQCIELASDLQEVQNVANVAFPNMTAQMNDFAKSAAANFGLSETMAKKYSSLYGTMAKQFGFTEKAAYEMGTTLTGLAGDVASFYNMSQDEAYTKLKSVFSGETETLKEIGVVMTQSALDAYALANGFGKTTKSMSEAEKVALRYAYVQSQLSAATGDFLRTSDSWANQTRLLKLNLQQLGTVIGGSFINAFKPLISTLNTVISKFTAFAQVVSDSLGKIFGWKYEDTGGGIASDLESGASSAGDILSGIDGAADSAKKLKQQLRGIDELNVISSSKDSSSGGGGSSGSGASSTSGQWVKTDSIFKGYESELDSLEKLGEHISTKLRTSLEKIKWDDVYKGAENFGTGLASFLNGLIEPETFGAVGKTVAGALNTAIKSVLAFGKEFEFYEFGESIATGINDFFKTFKAGDLAEGLSVWTSGILQSITGFIDHLETKEISDAFIDFFEGINYGQLLIDAIKLSLSIAELPDKIAEGVGEALKEGINTEKIAKSFEDILKKVEWGDIFKRVVVFALRRENLHWIANLIEMWDNLPDEMKKTIGEKNKEAGEDIVKGITEGIKLGEDDVELSISDFFWFFIKVLRNTFGIHSPATEMKPYGKNILLGIVEGFSGNFDQMKEKINTFRSNIENWWNRNKPNLSTIETKIKLPRLNVTWDTKGWAAEALQKLGLKGFPNFSVSYYAQGGFPEDGWFRAKHGEIMGKFDNGKSVVANNNQITEGISSAVYRGNQENNALMRQQISLLQKQNELLLGILEKESGISSDDIFNSVRKSADSYTRRTGEPAFA